MRPGSTCPLTGALLLIFSSSCWVEQDGISDAVWSDDDQMLAVTAVRYEVRRRDVDDPSGDTPARHYTRQIYVLPSDLSQSPEPLTERKTGIPELYLMSDAGYLLGTWADEGHQESYQYFLSGDSRKIFDENDLPELTEEDDHRGYDAIPSPDGDTVAIHHTEGTAASSLLLLDATSLERIFVDDDLPFGRIIWNPQGELVFLSNEVDGALSLRLSSLEWETVPEPTCSWPPTNSGPISEDGRAVAPGESLDEPVEFDAVEGSADQEDMPFGCP